MVAHADERELALNDRVKQIYENRRLPECTGQIRRDSHIKLQKENKQEKSDQGQWNIRIRKTDIVGHETNLQHAEQSDSRETPTDRVPTGFWNNLYILRQYFSDNHVNQSGEKRILKIDSFWHGMLNPWMRDGRCKIIVARWKQAYYVKTTGDKEELRIIQLLGKEEDDTHRNDACHEIPGNIKGITQKQMAYKVINLFGTGQFTGQKKPPKNIGQFQDEPYGIKPQQPF